MKALKPGRDFKSIWEPCLLCKRPTFFPWVGQRKLCTGCRAFVVSQKILGKSDEDIELDFELRGGAFIYAGIMLDAMEVPNAGREVA